MAKKPNKAAKRLWKIGDEELTEAQLLEAIRDRWWRLNHLYRIIDEHGREVTFRHRPVQAAIYASAHPRKVILKSRQHGVTTQRCIESLDDCLFRKNLRAGIIAHNRADAESFFADKIKFAYDRLPEGIRTIIPARNDSARELSFSNNSAIRVGVSMRSATLQRLHVSELGKICARDPKKAREIKTGAFNTVHAGQEITVESTAEGNYGLFFDLCQDAMNRAKRGVKLSPLDFEFHFYAWWQDAKNQLNPEAVDEDIPAFLSTYYRQLEEQHGIHLTEAQKAWYTAMWRTQGDDMHREHPSIPEEAFRGSLEGTYFKRQFERIYQEHRITHVPYEEGYPVDTYWDLGMNDTTVIWFVQTIGREIRVIDCYRNSGEGLDHYAGVLADKGYRYGVHMGPHDINYRELGTGVTRRERAIKFGLRFEVAPRLDKADQIEAARALLPYCWFDERRCQNASDDMKKHKENNGILALENYRKKWDEQNAVFSKTPLHDWCSDYADAFMTLAVTHELTAKSRRPRDDDSARLNYYKRRLR